MLNFDSCEFDHLFLIHTNTNTQTQTQVGVAGAVRRVSDHTTEIGLVPDAARDVVITNGRVVSGTLVGGNE